MATIVFISAQGERQEVAVPDGTSVMRAAVNNRIPGVVGECGGELQCATCHVYVDQANALPLPPVSEDEDEMLEAAACERTGASRLCCQLISTAETDGLVVHTPETQY